MATNWEAKFGKGKWVTVRGARVYIQEGKGLGSALQKLAGKKKTIKSPIRKAPQVSDTEKKIIGNNEKTIVNAKKKFGVRMNPIVDQVGDENNKDAYVALGKARAAREINRELKGRNPDGNWGGTGAADYNNKKEPRAFARDRNLLQSHERRVKEGILDAQKARKAAGTDGKLRSPVYADQKTGKLKLASGKSGVSGKLKASPESMQSFKNNKIAATIKQNEDTIKSVRNDPNAQISPLKTAKARIAISENSEIKRQNKPWRGWWQNSYDQLHAGDSTFANAYSKRTAKLPKIQQYEVKQNIKEAQDSRKYHGTDGKLRSDVYKDSPQQEAAAKTKMSSQKTKTTSNPVQGKASGSFNAKDAMGKLNKLATTLNNGGGHPYDDWRQARDILEKAPVGTTITALLNRGAKSVHIKKADGKWTNDSGAPYDTNTMSKYWYKGNNDIPEVDIYTPDMGKGSTRTPTLKEALKEKAGKTTRKK